MTLVFFFRMMLGFVASVAAAAAAAGAAAAAAAAAAAGTAETSSGLPYPPLSVIQGALLTTADEAFKGDQRAFAASADWHATTKLSTSAALDRPAPYLACTSPRANNGDDDGGFQALSHLRGILSSDPARARVVYSSAEHGVCFLASATSTEAATVGTISHRQGLAGSQLLSYWAPFPSALKLAPGLLNHDGSRDGEHDASAGGVEHKDPSGRRKLDGARHQSIGRLKTTHGRSLRTYAAASGDSEAHGLTVELAPGVLPATNRRRRDFDGTAAATALPHGDSGIQLVDRWVEELMLESLNLYETSFWSSSDSLSFAATAQDGRSASCARAGGLLKREWTRAADVLHGLGGGGGGGGGGDGDRPTVGDICSWDGMVVYHTDDDLLTLKGIDHLLPNGRGVGGRKGEEADELHVACFMGLLSFLASQPEVLRVSAARSMQVLNAAAFANVQSATVTDTPMSDSGLDGTGEVIQVTDTGLDYNSCFFVDEDGVEVEHGHYFEELGVQASALSTWSADNVNFQAAMVFAGGDFKFDLGRRKIVQYIDLIRQDNGSSTLPYGASWASTGGDHFPWISASQFSEDAAGGHGTHTAGSAAGATISFPVVTEDCTDGREVSCVGGCIDADAVFAGDDLLSSWESFYTNLPFAPVDLDRLCPRYDCDGVDETFCLGNDAGVTLAEHGGIARGAKLAIFDVLDHFGAIGIELAGNGIWEPAMEAGSKLHSSSWGGLNECRYLPMDVLHDSFMYNNPENLLIFSAGNGGDELFAGDCTIDSPALAKNALAVGASTSGPGRLTWTGDDGHVSDGTNRAQDIDIMAYFSSYGPSVDGRIKPEVVAPGDLVYSAAGSGTGDYTCRLWNYPGTSMSCPIVAGSAALVRQYFTNETFYAHDVETRGFCDSFGCEAFSPSAATVKAMLINSANLMGGTAEPTNIRGFGRVHLEPGMPLRGEGDRALFVADAAKTNTTEQALTVYSFEVDGDSGLDLRATLCWIDPPASAFSSIQLVHDLDLAVYSPGGTRYSMWTSGLVDSVNNNERVIVPAEDVEADPGTWAVRVWSKRLVASGSQSYSLVVTGAISPPSGNNETVAEVVVTSSSSVGDDFVAGGEATSGGGRSAVCSPGGNVVVAIAASVIAWLMASFAVGGGS